MDQECFNCSGEASERYTLVLENLKTLKDKVVCEDCVFVFQHADWVEVYEEPVLMRNGSSMTIERNRSHRTQEVDELLGTLSNPIRREIINYFEKYADGTTASLEDLVDHITRQMPTKNDDGVWKTLYQIHLPTLQSRGWLGFDTETKTILYHGHNGADRLLTGVYGIFSS